MKQPAALKKKDIIGITCPAGYMPAENAADCISMLQGWGYQVMVGKTLGSKSKTYFSGTDEERLSELQAMLDDENIKAILFGRGGYGVSRIIDRLDFTAFKKKPKWLIGFSDITVLHCHAFSKLKVMTAHAQMAAAFKGKGAKTESVLSIQKLLQGKKNNYKLPTKAANKKGKASGKMIGGNLSLLTNVIGTPSDFKTDGNIFFIEDLGEYLYATDRLLQQLKRAGKFKNCAAVIFGGFTDMKDTDRPFGKKISGVLAEIVADADYPVVFDFPLSHTDKNVAVKIGAEYKLSVGNKYVELKEV